MKDIKSAIEVINLTADDPTLLTQNVKQYSSDGIVKYGENDEQFDYLIRMATYSTTNGALIEAISQLLFGEGLNIKGLISDNDLRRVCTDFYTFGNATIQIVNGKLMHLPVNYVRAEEVNDDGKIENYYYNTDWATDSENYTVLPNWEMQPNAKHSIYYLRPYRPNAFYYNLPSYQSCLFYCELEEKVGQYLLNTVDNSFSVLKMINFNNGIPDEESRRKATKEIKDKTTGVKGDKVVVTFNEDKDHAAEIVDISVDNAADQYTYVSQESQNKILVGHKLTSPLILGIRDFSTGFGSNAEELATATGLFMKMQIEPKQRFIANAIGIITGRDDVEFLNEEIEEVTEEETELSKVNTDLEEFISLGHDELEGFELFSTAPVEDNDLDNEINDILEEEFRKEKTTLSKLIEYVGTGKATPTRDSSQDNENFAVRYRYKGRNSGKETRSFCHAMLSSNKLYRKEDIQRMKDRKVNPGFGKDGADTYDIWLYKGGGLLSDTYPGGTCRHFWQREIYLKQGSGDKRKINLKKKITVAESRRLGFRPETNNKKVGTTPHSNYTTRF